MDHGNFQVVGYIVGDDQDTIGRRSIDKDDSQPPTRSNRRMFNRVYLGKRRIDSLGWLVALNRSSRRIMSIVFVAAAESGNSLSG